MNRVPCLLCQAPTHLFETQNYYNWYICIRCLMLFIYPQPSIKTLSRYYSLFEYPAGRSQERRIRTRASSILAKLKKLNPHGRTLLDIGSGYGYFLDEAKKRSLKPYGIEPSAALSDYTKRSGSPVHTGDLDNYLKQHREKKFDFVTLIHVIEHVPDPEKLLTQAASLLRPGGILYIETPNMDSHLFYTELTEYTFLTPPAHLWILSASAMNLISKAIGIQLTHHSTYSYPEHFMGIVKRLVKRAPVAADPLEQSTEQAVHNNSSKTTNWLRYILFDRLLATFFYRLLNLYHKGSVLELYYRKR